MRQDLSEAVIEEEKRYLSMALKLEQRIELFEICAALYHEMISNEKSSNSNLKTIFSYGDKSHDDIVEKLEIVLRICDFFDEHSLRGNIRFLKHYLADEDS